MLENYCLFLRDVSWACFLIQCFSPKSLMWRLEKGDLEEVTVLFRLDLEQHKLD